jgi:exonuclease SbcC
MIKTLEIVNFQSHENSVLEFVPGLNVVSGTSDSGKSAIIRSLIWAFFNKPSGFGFRSVFAHESEETSVGIEFPEGYFIRRRTAKGNINEYEDKLGTHSALRTDVPESVSALSNITELNVQRQLDPYFLLQESPGEVARRLNGIVNLNIIDDSVKRVNRIVTEGNFKVSFLEEQLEQQEKALEQFEDYDEIAKELEALNQEASSIDSLKRSKNDLYEQIEKAASIQKSIDEFPDFDSIYKSVSRLKSSIEDVHESEKLADELDEYIEKWESLIREIDSIPSTEGIEELISSIESEISSISEDRKIVNQIKTRINEIIFAQREIKETDEKNARNMEKLEEWKKNNPSCPICGADQKHWSF